MTDTNYDIYLYICGETNAILGFKKWQKNNKEKKYSKICHFKMGKIASNYQLIIIMEW